MKRQSILVSAILIPLSAIVISGCSPSPTVPKEPNPPSGSKIQLQLRPKAGTTVPLVVITHQEVNMGSMGTTVQDSTVEIDLIIKEVDADGVVTMDYKYQRMAVNTRAPQGSVNMDSRKGGNDPGARAVQAVVGQAFTLKVDSTGKLIEIKNLDSLLGKVGSTANVPAIREMFRTLFAEEAMKQFCAPMWDFYPPTPVDNGDQWNTTMEVTSGFPMVMKGTWTLMDHGAGKSILRQVSEITASEAKLSMGPARLSYNLTGSHTGHVEVDEASGLFLLHYWEANISGTVTVAATSNSSGGMYSPRPTTPQTVPVKIKSTTTFKRK